MSETHDKTRGHVDVFEEIKTKRPSLYKVLLFNDDYTPREFVVTVLTQFFPVDETKANAIMLTAHIQGQAVCGTFPKEIAETKVKAIDDFVREYQLPLKFDLDEA